MQAIRSLLILAFQSVWPKLDCMYILSARLYLLIEASSLIAIQALLHVHGHA